jgi:hypothetical protein
MIRKGKTWITKNLIYILIIGLIGYGSLDFIVKTHKVNYRITQAKREYANIKEIIKIKYYGSSDTLKKSDLFVYVPRKK